MELFLYADMLRPFPTRESSLAIRDGYSRYPERKILQKKTSLKIIAAT